MSARSFENFVCIDWSGEAVARPSGLAMAHCARGVAAPALLRPARGWTRESVLDWLIEHDDAQSNLLIGLDLSPGLPFIDAGCYFPGHPNSPLTAKALWQMVDEQCVDEPHLSASTFPKKPHFSDHFRNQFGRETFTGKKFVGGTGRLRQAELRQRAAGVNPVSCFNLVGAAQVGKSSLTGMRLLNRLNGRMPIWPFDDLPALGPAMVEIYTSIAAREAGLRKGISKVRDLETLNRLLAALGSDPHPGLVRYDDHSTDAILTAAWLRAVADDPRRWSPQGLTPEIAATEGWTFGAL